MDTQFFLAANSGRGFRSFYDGFPGEGAFLHILKGGPGTGKSSFLKSIRARAAELGYDTESILCSGDPDSLDGLYIPALGLAWADGTAPHALEPRIFGMDADYMNLGRFCRPLDKTAGKRAAELHAAYKEQYRQAYTLLRGALALEEAGALPPTAEELEAAEKLIREALSALPEGGPGTRQEERGFLSAISCRGLLRLEETLRQLGPGRVLLPGPSAALETAARLAAERGRRVIRCLRPLNPEETEAVILPEAGIAFLAEKWENREGALRDAVCARAVGRLREAKRLHDELEAVYRPFVDFAALTDFTESTLQKLFPEE